MKCEARRLRTILAIAIWSSTAAWAYAGPTTTMVRASMSGAVGCTVSTERRSIEGSEYSLAPEGAVARTIHVGRVLVTCARNTSFRLSPISGESELVSASGKPVAYAWSLAAGGGPFVATGVAQTFDIDGRFAARLVPQDRYRDRDGFAIGATVLR